MGPLDVRCLVLDVPGSPAPGLRAPWVYTAWDLPPGLAFGFICLVTMAILAVTYRYGVRYTPVGRLLNGRKHRAEDEIQAITDKYVAEIDQVLADKEAELMEV